VWKGVAFLDKDLVANSTTSGVKVDSMFPSERLDGCVFSQILQRFVLDVVVKSENRLLGVMNIDCSDRIESADESLKNRWQSQGRTEAHFVMTGPVLSWVMTCSGRIMT
jgi:hypothetical protein